MIEFEKLASAFVSLADNVVARTQIGLKIAAEYIQHQCKEVIGNPQPEWRPLTESTEQIKQLGGYPQNAPLLRTGEYKDSIKTELHFNEAIIYSDVPQAFYQEYGTKWAPPRPVFLLVLHRDEEFILSLIGRSLMVTGLKKGIPVPKEFSVLPSEIKSKYFSEET